MARNKNMNYIQAIHQKRKQRPSFRSSMQTSNSKSGMTSMHSVHSADHYRNKGKWKSIERECFGYVRSEGKMLRIRDDKQNPASLDATCTWRHSQWWQCWYVVRAGRHLVESTVVIHIIELLPTALPHPEASSVLSFFFSSSCGKKWWLGRGSKWDDGNMAFENNED